MTTYTLLISGVSHKFINLGFTQTHPNPDPDIWWATLPLNDSVADEDEIEIQRDGTTVFKGIVEEREPEMSSKGIMMRIGGRHTKVKVWRRWHERNEDPKSGGFWLNYYPHDIIQFYIHPSKSDIEEYHRAGWGINPADDWAITTNPAGSKPKTVKDRLVSFPLYGWNSNANQATGHYVCVDLGSAKSISAIRVENRITGRETEFPQNYKIQYSNTSCTAGLTDLVTVTGNVANNIVHAWTPVSARYWRIYLTAAKSPSNTEWTVGEIYLYESDGEITGITEGTLDSSHAKLDEAVDFTWQRRTDAIQKITDLTETANVSWEWWVTDDGAVNFASRRGTDKSASIQFVYSVDMVTDSYRRDSKMKVDRIMVLGSGKGNDQDLRRSDWIGSGNYEKVVTEKELKDQTAAINRANVLLNELSSPIVTIKCEVVDDYATGEWEVGDDITLTDTTTGLSGSVRVKKVMRRFDDSGETVTIEASNYRETVTEYFTKVQRALQRLERIQDEYASINFRDMDESFLLDLSVARPAFIDYFNWFNSTLWTEAGNNSVTPDVVNIDNFPALRIQTAGANVDSTWIYTGSTIASGVWRYLTKVKFNQTASCTIIFGLSLSDLSQSITFYWDSVIGRRCACQDAVGITFVTLSNYPSLTEWHVYRIDWISGSEVNFYVDELLVATITTNVPSTSLNYFFYILASAAAVKTMYVRGVAGQQGVEE